MSAPPSAYTPRDDVPPPSAEVLAAGIVGPLDIPISSPIPLLRIKKREYRRCTIYAGMRRCLLKNRKHEGRAPYIRLGIKRLRRLKRLRSNYGLPVTTLTEQAQELQKLDEDFHVNTNLCIAYKSCRIVFESFTDLYEHQLDVHGGLDPRANRVVNDTFHQQRGKLAFPPATVYAAQQYMVPSRPPIPWESMEELDEEAKIVRDKLRDYNMFCFETPYKLFETGYKLVKRNGWKEVQRQYQIAMEHFYSGMKFPASSRGFHDGCPSVERGRNWLTSTDREDSRLLYPFSLGDKMDGEPEFVLIDTKRDQEMQEIEISDNSDDEDLSTSGNSDCEEKIFKKGDDVDMTAPDDDDFKPMKEQKVFSDDEIELKTSGGDEGKTTSERKVFDADSDSDVTVKSEADSDSEFRLEKSRTADASDSDSGDEVEVELNVSRSDADETAHVSEGNSSSEDEVELKDFKSGDDDTVSESDTSSDDEVELKVFKNGNPVSDTNSESVHASLEDSSDSDVESKSPQHESSQFVSESESD